MTVSIIESLKAQIGHRVEAVKSSPAMSALLKLHSDLNNLEDLENIPRTSMSELFGLDPTLTENACAPTLLQPGQYFGKTPQEATKDYLECRGKGATLDEIIAALKTGSCDPGSREEFNLSLARSTFNFVKLNIELFDLLDRYPNLKKKRQSGGGKRTSIVARAEEIMRHDAPISINKAIAQAEQEQERDVEELKKG
jgi:hypothetical protein